MVDAATGYHDNAPGRMSAIYTAGLMAWNREEGETDVFEGYLTELLCQINQKEISIDFSNDKGQVRKIIKLCY